MTHGAHKPLIFISDLHLQDSRPELTDALVRFLAEQRGAARRSIYWETCLRSG